MDYAESRTASLYGRETYYEARSQSPAPSQFGVMYPPPGYNSGRNTPQSPFRSMNEANQLLHQPTPSRPVTNYLDMPIPTVASHEGFDMGPMSGSIHGGGLPSDVEIERAVQNVLRTADLNTVTKREIRRQLEEVFGMDLTSRKTTINAAIDRILLSQA
jgi:chitin synthase